MCQIDFSVMRSPHVRPILVTLRKILPRAIPAASNHASNCPFTQPGIGTVRRALPCRLNRQSPSVLRVAVSHQSSGQRLRVASAHTPAATQEVLGPAFLELLAIWRLPKRVSLLYRQPVSKANTEFLHTFDTANASCEIRTEQAAIGSFVGEPPHSAQAQVDSFLGPVAGTPDSS